MKETITVRVRMDAKTFKRFARYDGLIKKGAWRRPALFALILLAFSVFCFWTRRPQSGLIGAVLAVIGIGLPLVYFGTFFSQVNLQVEKLRLDKPRPVYTLTLSQEGFRVKNEQRAERELEMPYREAHTLCRGKGASYLYAAPNQAFILPDGQADAPPQEVWALISAGIGAEKVTGRYRSTVK